MKYIRTKDGRIFKVLSEDERFLYLETYEDIGVRLWEKGKDDILNQADTIEELCDEFVAVNIKHNYCRLTSIHREKYYEHYKNAMYYVGEYTHDYVDTYIKYTGLVYGAIWTEKGLIYVAKVKGVLPNGEINWELL